MKKAVFAAVLALCAVAQPALSENSEFQITPRIGQGELRLDEFELADPDLYETDTYTYGLGLGVKTPIGLLFEIGADAQGNVGFFDDEFSLTQRYIAVGYQFELGDGWRLIPKVGRVRWKLRSDEGPFHFHEHAAEEIRGYEYVYEATIGKKISRVVTLGLNYKQGDYDFGRARALSFVVQIGI
jgi:hypothetical protein